MRRPRSRLCPEKEESYWKHCGCIQGSELRKEQLLRGTRREIVERPHNACVVAQPGYQSTDRHTLRWAQDPLAKSVEDLIRSDYNAEFHSQPVHEEPIGTYSRLPSLARLRKPVVIRLKCRLPELVVELICWSLLALPLEEDGILDEIKGTESGSTSVERFEDYLCVVPLIQVDGDYIDEAFQARLQDADASGCGFGLRSAVVCHPVPDTVMKIAPRSANAA